MPLAQWSRIPLSSGMPHMATAHGTPASIGDAGLPGSEVIEAGPPGFEPGSEAPEAPMLSKLYYEPNVLRYGV